MRVPKWNEETIKRRESEGRGKGSGATYKPWITVADFSSLGVARRPWSEKTKRHHELFSDVEYNLFVCLEWAQEVEDIREQFPFDRSLTLEVAQKLGIRHPHYPNTKIPVVMTVDFLATVRRNGQEQLIGFDAKRDEEAEDETSLGKLEIMRAMFENLEIPYHLVFHSSIPKQKAKNIDWIRNGALKPGEAEPHQNYFSDLTVRMASELANASATTALNDFCASFDAHNGALPGTGLRVARLLMNDRILVPDLESQNLQAEPIKTFQVTGALGRLRAMGGH
ncbi:MAG: TnsA endonuclease N-terminal domain-containing protein [Gallionella sp.]|jgi:hypothetical protein